VNRICEQALARARRNPGDIIVRDSRRSWTWAELTSEAEDYATAIMRAATHFPAGAPVPLLVARRGEFLPAFLACAMTGRCAAPLSPDQPAERLAHCLEVLDTDIAIDAGGGEELDPALGIRLLGPEPDGPSPGIAEVAPEDPLYLLFTSGSTGKPKGAVCSHASALNTIDWSQPHVGWRDDDVIGVATSFHHDISLFDVLSCLLEGIGLSIFADPRDPRATLAQIRNHDVSSIFAVPAFFSAFVRAELLDSVDESSLRQIISGGDFFPTPHMLAWATEAPSVRLVNCWGPTETSMVNTMHEIGPEDIEGLKEGRHPPVGRAEKRQPFELVTEDGQDVAEGSEKPGEIWMQGPSVGLGYYRAPELTAEKFVERGGLRAYRTGDLGRLDAEGRLYITGRLGSTVKIAGNRVDLGEVEEAIRNLPQVHQAIAFVENFAPGVDEIWAAIEPGIDIGEFDIFTAKRALRKTMISHMVPRRLIPLASLPLNAVGKIDRGAAAELARQAAGKGENHA
jgi:amino acid adenylation domain-containing protein